MQKITFEDLPSTATPINATNLNAVQTNVENAIPELDTIYGTSTTNGYAQSYINSLLGVAKITELPLTFSKNGTSLLLNYTIGDFDNGIILINGHLENGEDVFLTTLIDYATRYSANVVISRGTNMNNSAVSLTNNNKTLSLVGTGSTLPSGIGTVKAILISLN